MKIQQLRYVVATSELGTMTAAAAALHVAQPALSRAVRALETELQVQIFVKEGRGIRLTEEGQDVVAIATRILAEVDRLAAIARDWGVTLCATKGQARELAAPAVSTQVEQGEQVRLTVVDSREEVFDTVHANQADLGLVELPAPVHLTAISLGWQEFLLAHPPDWQLPDPLPARQLADVPLLSAPNGDWRRDALVSGLQGSGIEPNIAAETTERELMAHLVVEGAGAAFLYGRQARAAAAAGAALVHITPPPIREIGVVCAGPPTGQAADLVDTLRSHAHEVLLDGDDPHLAGAARIAGPLLLRTSSSAPRMTASAIR